MTPNTVIPNKKPLSVNVVTLGCSKNLVDSENLMARLKKGGFDVKADDPEDTDIVIINTCGFIHDAKEESIDTILEYAALKSQGRIKKLLVMGCLSQRYPSELQAEIPEADGMFGVEQQSDILTFLGSSSNEQAMPSRIVTTGHYAYLKIAEGCDRQCSFCAIPMIRGSHKSREEDDILNEFAFLTASGVKEILLISQDLSYYGYDLYRESRLASLLGKMAKSRDDIWIRLHYAYPSRFPEDILPVIRENSNICRYLDIPFQHISDPILKSMRRGINRKETLKLIDKIRAEVPGIALRTSLMVGYPGESEAMFRELAGFVEETRFNRLGVFTYSHEENTAAANLPDDVPAVVKQERMEIIMGIQEKISEELNGQMTGKDIRVLIDRREGEYLVGRTEFDSPEVDNEVLVRKPWDESWTGSFVNARIEDSGPYELYARIVS